MTAIPSLPSHPPSLAPSSSPQDSQLADHASVDLSSSLISACCEEVKQAVVLAGGRRAMGESSQSAGADSETYTVLLGEQGGGRDSWGGWGLPTGE